MIQYIYFVKCPNCEDEHFDFFDDAKAYALGCLSAKPIITQTEVERDDFGCCTNSCDLGTIWSYEDIIGDDCGSEKDNEISTFSKSDTFDLSEEDFDKEFEDDEITITVGDTEIEIDDDEIEIDQISYEDKKEDIPTIEALVEMMEENEDMVECKWCEELFEKSECRYEVDLGYLCHSCEAAIKSRGETLTFRENNYWDFLDEDKSAEETTWTCVFDDKEIGTVTAATEEEALEKMVQEYPDYSYGAYDGCYWVIPVEADKLTETKESSKLSEGTNRPSTVDLEYEDFEDSYGPSSYTYTVDEDEIIDYIYNYHIDDYEGLPKEPDEYTDEELRQYIIDNFDTLFALYESDIYEYFREACDEEYYSHDWEEIAYEQAMELQWECDNDK